MRTLIKASDVTFDQEVMRSTETVLVFFLSPNCGYCHNQQPIFEELVQEFGDKIRFVSVDITKNLTLANKYKVSGVPSFAIFKDKKLIKNFSGFMQKHQLEDILKYYA